LGEFEWENGSKYIGHYVKDKKQGFGDMEWYDGHKYSGFWHKGHQHGLGILSDKDGKTKAGYFNNNVFVKALTSKEEFEVF
jgi:hypothetical protein